MPRQHIDARVWSPRLLLAWACACGIRAIAFADVPPPATAVAWNPTEPINQADVKEFVLAHWDDLWIANASGVSSLTAAQVQAEFHNELPSDFGLVYLPWERVFRIVFADRLFQAHDGSTYDVWQLMADDELVRAQFREFVVTGKLAPQAEQDVSAASRHCALALEAISNQSGIEVDQICLDEAGNLETLNLRAAAVPRDAVLLLQPPQETSFEYERTVTEQRLCDLRWWVRASHLRCMYEAGLWKDDQHDDGFDCDDFMIALRNWLVRKMGDSVVVGSFLFRWKCEGHGEYFGHWMPTLMLGGKYYLIDPYTGEVVGPYPFSPAGRRQMAMRGVRFLDKECKDESGRVIEPQWEEPPCFPTRGFTDAPVTAREPRPPFWGNPASMARFCEHLAECCGRTPQTSHPHDGGEYVDLEDLCMPPPSGASGWDIESSPCDGVDYLPNPTPVSVTPSCRHLPPP